MKSVIALLGLALVLGTQSSLAAEIATPATYDWTGPYVGIHAGGIWGRTDLFENGILVDPNKSVNGFVAGGLLGYNYQDGQMIYGFDADIAWSNAHGNGTAGPPPDVPNDYDMLWDGHTRVRLGYAPDEGALMLFVAGGLAFSDLKLKVGDTGQIKDTLYVGGSIGAGAEYGFSDSVTGRLEYIYDNYGVFGQNGIVLNNYMATLRDASTVRAAISFRF